MTVAEPALTAFVFAPGHDPALPGLWQRIGDAIGADRPLRTGVPVDWPADRTPADDWHERMVAARRAPVADGLAEAVAFDRRDFTGLGVALGRAGEHPLSVWQELRESLRDHLVGVPGVGLCFLGRADDVDEADVRGALRSAVWPGATALPDGGFRWDGQEGTTRVTALVTPDGGAAAVEAWAWWRPGGPFVLPLLARHWLSAALLDHQCAVLMDLDKQVREAGERAGERAHGVAKAGPGGLDEEGADALEARLADVTRDVVDLTGLSTRLKDARRAIVSLQHNLGQVQRAFDGAGGVVLERDITTADRWQRQAEQTTDHAESASLRAGELLKLAQVELAVEQHRLTARQQRFTSVQTAVIAALLAGLGALTTLGVSYTPPGHVRLPLLLTLVGLVVAAPLLAGGLHRKRFRVVDCVAGAFVAGAATWAGLAVWTGHPWWPGLVGLVVAVVAGLLLFLRGRSD